MNNKIIPYSMLILIGGAVAHADQNEEYTNQIIQIQHDELNNEIRYPVVVDKYGEMPAPLPILFGECIFELWSVKNDNLADPRLLDTTEVNGYFSPEIWIDTPDPNDTFAAPRTRADIPFDVRIAGVGEDYIDNAVANMQLLWNHEDLPAGSHEFPDGYEVDYTQGTSVNALLPMTLSGSVTAYPNAEDNSEVWGREIFSLWEQGESETPMLSTRALTVWPTATIGFADGKSFEDGATIGVFPEIQVNFDDLYAVDSWSVWAESAEGEKYLLSSGAVVGNTPQDRQAPIRDALSRQITKPGTYTLYASQQAEGLDPEPNIKNLGSFTFDNKIRVRAYLGGHD